MADPPLASDHETGDLLLVVHLADLLRLHDQIEKLLGFPDDVVLVRQDSHLSQFVSTQTQGELLSETMS